MAKPDITITSDKLTKRVVFSPKIILEIMTVNTGAVLLTVSAKETGTYQRAYKPSTKVENLKKEETKNELKKWSKIKLDSISLK